MKLIRLIPSLLLAILFFAPPLHAQQRRRQQGRPDGVALPQRVAPVTPQPAQPPLQPVPAAADSAPPANAPALPEKDAASTVASPSPVVKDAPPIKDPPTPVKGGIMLNFQGTSLTDVLNYLSEAAGFVILQDAPIAGTVNVVSKQPVSPDEAVDLLNAVLAEKGFTAIRNDRILKIVSRKDALKRDIPVGVGSESGTRFRAQRRDGDANPAAAFRRSSQARREPAPAAARQCDDQRQRKQQRDHHDRFADEHPAHRADHPRARYLGREHFDHPHLSPGICRLEGTGHARDQPFFAHDQ